VRWRGGGRHGRSRRGSTGQRGEKKFVIPVVVVAVSHSSISLRLFLVFFAGGEAISGDGGGDGAWVGGGDGAAVSATLGGLLELNPPVQRWRLYHAFNGGDGGGSASRLQRWSRLALAHGRTR
jgi:hypothetical protein